MINKFYNCHIFIIIGAYVIRLSTNLMLINSCGIKDKAFGNYKCIPLIKLFETNKYNMNSINQKTNINNLGKIYLN